MLLSTGNYSSNSAMFVHSHKPQVFRLVNVRQRERKIVSSNFIKVISELLPECLDRSQKPPPSLITILTGLPKICYAIAFSSNCKLRFGEKSSEKSMKKIQKLPMQTILGSKQSRMLIYILGIVSNKLLTTLFSKLIERKQGSIEGQVSQEQKQNKATFIQMFAKGFIRLIERIRQAMGSAEDIMSHVEWLILIVYMLDWNKHFTFIETLLGINYTHTYANDRIRDVSYAIEGYLLLTNLLTKAAKHFYGIFNSDQRKKQSNIVKKATSIFSKKIGTVCKGDFKENSTCQLCFGHMHNKSSTKCGHVFCWLCIIQTLQQFPECPVCHSHCEPQQVVQLKNF